MSRGNAKREVALSVDDCRTDGVMENTILIIQLEVLYGGLID